MTTKRHGQSFFREHRLSRFAVRYEELVADPARIVSDILQFLDLPDRAPDLDAVRLRALSDARNVLLARVYEETHLGARKANSNGL